MYLLDTRNLETRYRISTETKSSFNEQTLSRECERAQLWLYLNLSSLRTKHIAASDVFNSGALVTLAPHRAALQLFEHIEVCTKCQLQGC